MATSKNTKTFVDLDLSFKANPFTKDIYLKTDEEAVKTALKHLIQTKNFDMCPMAYQEFTKLIPIIGSIPPQITGRTSPTIRQMRFRNFLE